MVHVHEQSLPIVGGLFGFFDDAQEGSSIFRIFANVAFKYDDHLEIVFHIRARILEISDLILGMS